MMPARIVVTGATGFIGTRMCERLHLHYKLPFRAAVRSFGNAARIARMGTEMVPGNLLVPEMVARAIADCDAVIHLAHGEDTEAARATANLIEACKQARVRRFVHVSSMSVHGPSPSAESAHESTAKIGRYRESYCDAKAEEEEIVQRAIDRDGFPAVILRPTVVYGPYSAFVLQAVMAARTGMVSLIDNGVGACNAVYVDDVCDALYAAVTTDRAVGEAMFINGNDAITWKDFTLAFAKLVDPSLVVTSISSVAADAYWAAQQGGLSDNVRAAKQLLTSTEFHRQLGTVPMVGLAIRTAKGRLLKLLSEERIAAIKRRNIAAATSRPSAQAPWPNIGRLRRETVTVRFSNQKAEELLNWRPVYDFSRGVELTRTWLEFARLIPARSETGASASVLPDKRGVSDGRTSPT